MKIHKLAALGAVAALALTACSSDPNPGETTAPTTKSTVPAAERSITFWVAGTDTNDDMRKFLVDTFKEKTGGATLKIEQIEWKELVPRLQTALPNAEQTPDLVEIGNTQAPTFTSVGAFTDLTASLADLGGEKVGPKSFVEAGTYDGKLYAVPYYWGSRYVFYNTDVFEKEGVKVPTTLAEFNEAAKKLTTADRSGLWLPGQDWRNGLFWLFANGGNIATVEGGKWVGGLSSPESQTALAQIQDIYTNGTKAPKDGLDEEPWVPFNEGDSAMFIAPGWARWSVKEDVKFAPLAVPGVEAGSYAAGLAGGSNLAISAKSKNQDLALELLKVIYSEEYQTLLAKNGMGPAISDFNSLMGDDEFAKAAIASAENSKLTPGSPGWASVEAAKLMEETFGKIAAGGDIVAIAKDADARLGEMLN
ncbi:extracellular solute-binding protein [Sanguibacter sp. A247]|uniref:extracellular solute-binding protein n=1 Tax=unclassified Sanguibacter TaxID=2645534 RepID=UPI003FD714FB